MNFFENQKNTTGPVRSGRQLKPDSLARLVSVWMQEPNHRRGYKGVEIKRKLIAKHFNSLWNNTRMYLFYLLNRFSINLQLLFF